MYHILLWALIALVILIVGITWKWLVKLELRSRRKRGNNYLYQEYNYNHDIDYRAIDLAWESHQKNLDNHQLIQENLELDSEAASIDRESDGDSWQDYRDNLSLHQAIEGYLNLELDKDSAEPKKNSHQNRLSAEGEIGEDASVDTKTYRSEGKISIISENSEVGDEY